MMRRRLCSGLLLSLLLGDVAMAQAGPVPVATLPAAPQEAKIVSLVSPGVEQWPEWIPASGNILPWQESRIGAEVGGLRLASVLVSVGDVVKKGQVLAKLNADTVETELDAANAQLAEAKAALAQAAATLDRGRRLVASGGVSQQEITLYETQKQTAEARVNAAKAQVRRQQLRLDYATLEAPDDGIISASSAMEGMIVQSGTELFRLIRQGRLEWRAAVKGEQLLRLSPGQEVVIKSPFGSDVKGRVRRVSPTIDLVTGNGLVFVDLAAGNNLKAGLMVSGMIELGKRRVLAVPESALLGREGEQKVLVVDEQRRLSMVPVEVGQIRNGRAEIISGLDDHARVVAKEQRGLVPGDLVRTAAAGD